MPVMLDYKLLVHICMSLFQMCCFFCYSIYMLVKSKLCYEEFVDLMFLLGGDNVERMKRCWKLVTGERLYWKGDGIVEVRGISAVDNFGRLLSAVDYASRCGILK